MKQRDLQSVFLALTIGFPFCIFKVLCGRVAIDSGHLVAGYVLFGWGTVDFILNLLRVIQGFIGRKPKTQFCLLSAIGSLIKQGPLFLAVDTFLAFGIICLVLWTGWIGKLTTLEIKFWLAATTVNLMSVGIVQIWCSYHNNGEKTSE